MLSRLQYISQGSDDPATHLENIRKVLDAGVELVQLRLKKVSFEIYRDAAQKAREWCDAYGAVLIINDNPEVAKACGATVLHLGLDDSPVAEARRIAPGITIGGTANTIQDIRRRNEEKVDYIGLGPFRFTGTKEKLSPVLGLEGYQTILEKMREEGIDIPVYAIGGIERNDIAAIMETGVYGIAVSGLITNSAGKEQLVKEINERLNYAEDRRQNI